MGQLDISSPGACWPWLGYINPQTGYGQVTLRADEAPRFGGHRIITAPRLMCWLTQGPPEGRHCLHSCDNRPCANPAHLRWGTPGQNLDDRRRSLDPAKRMFGEAHPRTKHPAATVAAAREMHKEGHSVGHIARTLGVPYHTARAWLVRGFRSRG